jgi:hypothetical protein
MVSAVSGPGVMMTTAETPKNAPRCSSIVRRASGFFDLVQIYDCGYARIAERALW